MSEDSSPIDIPSNLTGFTIDDEDTFDFFSLLRERRGWSEEYLATIDNPAHDTLKDMEKMLEALKRIHDSQELLVVVPDFDMDGITSGTLGYAGFAELGFNVTLHIPDYNRGHDVSAADIAEVYQLYPAVKAIITCDGGINSHEGIDLARNLGLTTLVTDHHVELEPGCNADVTIDPARIDETYSNPGICGAHVLYQVLNAYTLKYMPRKLHSINMLKLFAGIGTVSDVMPLLFENRQLVRDSVSLARLLYVAPPRDLSEGVDHTATPMMTLLQAGDHHPVFFSAFEGFAVALAEFVKAGKLRSITDVNEGFYGFYLAPAFNAARRVGTSMYDCFGVFIAPTPEEKAACMRRVIASNELRKKLTVQYLEELATSKQPLAPYVYFSPAPAGMLGLIANQLMQVSNVPTVVIQRDSPEAPIVGGSARSPFWFKVIATMTEAGFTAIGHENACGVKVSSYEELVRFHAYMRDSSQSILAELQASGELADATAPDMRLGSSDDCDANLSDIDGLTTMTERIETLVPFGHGFPRPQFELVLNLAQCHIKLLGQPIEAQEATEDTEAVEAQGPKHLQIVTRNGIKCVWWNSADKFLELQEKAEALTLAERTVRLRVSFFINAFRGFKSVQAQVEYMVDEGLHLTEELV